MHQNGIIMSRVIMLIPLDEDVGLTSISLSMIHFFNKNKFEKKPVQSMLYFFCIKKSLDDTLFIINKNFSKTVSTVDNIDFSQILFNSPEYFFLLNKISDQCRSSMHLYEVILIEGMSNIYSKFRRYVPRVYYKKRKSNKFIFETEKL